MDSTVTGIVSKVTMQVGAHVKDIMTHRNGLVAMISAGSKGNPINLSQIMGCVGQNCVNGSRICVNPDTGRALPSYPLDDISVNGRGFVSNSYTLGVEPDEYFFHAMGGREGLVDTAVKTAVTGYIQRRMVKAGESYRTSFDRSVRGANNSIVEFVYGGDGMDPIALERVYMPYLDYSNEQLRNYCVPLVEDSVSMWFWSRSGHGNECVPKVMDLLIEEYEHIIQLRDEVRQGRSARSSEVSFTEAHLPCNIAVILQHLVSSRDTPQYTTSLTSWEVKELVDSCIDKMCEHMPMKTFTTFAFTIRYHLCSNNIINKHHLNHEELCTIVKSVYKNFTDALVVNGTMVGCIAAQSIGEKCTQMTLNTFHLAGVLQSITMGIPRFKELIDLSKQIKTPCMRVCVIPSSGENNKITIEEHSLKLKGQMLSDVINDFTVLKTSDIVQDPLWEIHSLFWCEEDCKQKEDTPYICGKMFLDMEKCAVCGIRPWQIGIAIETQTKNMVRCAWSNTQSSESWVVLLQILDVVGLQEFYGIGTDNNGQSIARRVPSQTPELAE